MIANSAYTATLVRPYLDDGDRRLRIINPPIGQQPEPPAHAKDHVRRLIAGRAPVLLSLSRLEPRKGVDMVIRALRTLIASHPNTVLVVAGDGDDRVRLERVVAENDVAAHVIFTGAVDGDKKAALFAAADLFAMPCASTTIGTSRSGNSSILL